MSTEAKAAISAEELRQEDSIKGAQCQAIKKNGERCKVTRAITLCSNPHKDYGDALFCPAHWKNPPEYVSRFEWGQA